MSEFVKQMEILLQTMSNELPAGEIHRLVLYPDSSGMVESEGYEQFEFLSIVAQMVARGSIDLLFAIRRDLQRHGGLRWRFAISFIVAFILIVAILHFAPHIIGVLNGG